MVILKTKFLLTVYICFLSVLEFLFQRSKFEYLHELVTLMTLGGVGFNPCSVHFEKSC